MSRQGVFMVRGSRVRSPLLERRVLFQGRGCSTSTTRSRPRTTDYMRKRSPRRYSVDRMDPWCTTANVLRL